MGRSAPSWKTQSLPLGLSLHPMALHSRDRNSWRLPWKVMFTVSPNQPHAEFGLHAAVAFAGDLQACLAEEGTAFGQPEIQPAPGARQAIVALEVIAAL